MADTKQVTVMFESQVNNPQTDDPILLSGPIEVLGTTDTFSDLGTIETRDSIIETYSLEEDSDVPSITIFVDDVSTLGLNNPNHRGAYFRYAGTIEDLFNDSLWGKTGSAIHLWKEILLGTHSHSNPDVLEKLSTIFSINSSGEIELTEDWKNILETESSNSLPELPDNIKAKIEELHKYDDLQEPADSEWNHLDAPLDELRDTYDWLLHDENGHYRNLAVGNCREIYRSLKKSDRKLFVSLDDFSLSKEGSVWFQLEAVKVNYNIGADTDPTTLIAVQSGTSTEKIVFTFDLPFNITSNDHIFLFDGDKIIVNGFSKYGNMQDITVKDTAGYTITKISANRITVEFYKSDFTYTADQVLTILLACDVDPSNTKFDFLLTKAFAFENITLQNINAELLKLYVQGELNRRPYIPRMYLTTDEYGTIHWENKLLPSQTFEHKTLTITDAYLAEHQKTDGSVDVAFDLLYEVDEDFPLLLVDKFFDFDTIPHTDSETGKMVYTFNKEDIPAGTVINLVLIKKSSAGSIADEIAENYVSKEDAINILSHGKLDLSDYVTMGKLSQYAKLGHTHSQYALKEHNHDYRYANYRHTHPELCALLLELSKNDKVTDEDINAWLNKIAESNTDQFKALINSLGYIEDNGTYKLYDENITLSDEEISKINEALENVKSEARLNSGDSVKDAILALTQLFDDDTALDTQVILQSDINVTNKIGGTPSIYKAGTSISTILNDMLNPKIDLAEMKNILIPTTIELSFYSSADDNHPVDFQHVKNHDELYFKVKLKNIYGNSCTAPVIVSGYSYTQSAEIVSINDITADENGYFHISDITDLYTDEYNNINIPMNISFIIKNTIVDKSYLNTNVIYDTYAISSFSITNASLNYNAQGCMDYPDYYYAYAEPSSDVYTVISINQDDFKPGYDDSDSSININVTSGGILYILLEDGYEGNIKIIDNTSGIDILQFMEEDSVIKDGYTTYTYNFLNTAKIDLTISANR